MLTGAPCDTYHLETSLEEAKRLRAGEDSFISLHADVQRAIEHDRMLSRQSEARARRRAANKPSIGAALDDVLEEPAPRQPDPLILAGVPTSSAIYARQAAAASPAPTPTPRPEVLARKLISSISQDPRRESPPPPLHPPSRPPPPSATTTLKHSPTPRRPQSVLPEYTTSPPGSRSNSEPVNTTAN